MMPSKKVNEEQLDALFDFMRSKRVRYYDLQVELVDHFASAIEELWREDPKLSLEAAIHKVYDEFPVTGFSSVIDKQTQAIQKEAWRWVFRAWTTYFRWPKILLSIAVLLAVRLLFYLPISFSLSLWVTCLIIFCGGFWTIFWSKRKATRKEKRFLRLEATYSAIHHFVSFTNVLFYITLFNNLEATTDWIAWLMSFFFTYLTFLLYIIFYRLPKKAEEDLRRHFPAYAN